MTLSLRAPPPATPVVEPETAPAVGAPLPEGGILGTVWRGGELVPPTIEVRRLRGPERWRETSWRERDLALLDGPVAGDPVATAEAGEDGRFADPGIPAGTFEVRATAPDGATAMACVRRIGVRERSGVDLDLPAPGSELRGTILRADGTPWRSEIRFALPEDSYDPDYDSLLADVPRATCGETGRFVATGLPPSRKVWPAFRIDADTLIGAPRGCRRSRGGS